MTEDTNYLREVESYFLSLAGEGLMLSSIDYRMISGWKERNVPRELVLKGISIAFKNTGVHRGGETRLKKIRNIKQCASYVELCIKEQISSTARRFNKGEAKAASGTRLWGNDSSLPKGKSSAQSAFNTSIIGDTTVKLANYIELEKRGEVKDYYKCLRTKILDLGNNEDLEILMRIEKECLNHFYDLLSKSERKQITSDAEDKIKERVRYMTDTAYRESLESFRDELIRDKYEIKQIL